MNKIWCVTRSEYLNAVQSKAFVIGVILMPILLGGSLLVQALLKDKVDISDRKIAILDYSGKLHSILSAAAKERNQTAIFDPESKNQNQPRFIIEEPKPASENGAASEPQDGDRIDTGLSQRVRDGELFAFLIIGKDIFEIGGEDQRLAYHTETPTFRDLPNWIERRVNEEVKRQRFAQAGLDRELVDRINRRIRIDRLGLVKVDASGEVQEAEKENEILTYGIPAGSMFLLFMLIMMTAPALLNSVLEEKMQKISEVLISSVTPFELMMGKLLGTVLVSATLSTLYVGAVVFMLHRYEMLDAIAPSVYLWFFVYQLLALLMFGSIFIAIGAACSEIRDAQSLMAPAMLIVMIPLFCWFAVLQAPTSTFSRTISLVPVASPLLMLLRIAVPPGPPAWEIILSVVLTTGCAVLCVAVGAKVFRIGILSQGQSPGFGKILKWIVSK